MKWDFLANTNVKDTHLDILTQYVNCLQMHFAKKCDISGVVKLSIQLCMYDYVHTSSWLTKQRFYKDYHTAIDSHLCSLRQVTMSSHYVKSLCQITTSSHYVKSLCQVTMSNHYVKSLCQVTMSSHYVKSLCQVTTSSHYVKSLRQVTMSSHYVKSLCRGLRICQIYQICLHFKH